MASVALATLRATLLVVLRAAVIVFLAVVLAALLVLLAADFTVLLVLVVADFKAFVVFFAAALVFLVVAAFFAPADLDLLLALGDAVLVFLLPGADFLALADVLALDPDEDLAAGFFVFFRLTSRTR